MIDKATTTIYYNLLIGGIQILEYKIEDENNNT
jgi:hypothetical protein